MFGTWKVAYLSSGVLPLFQQVADAGAGGGAADPTGAGDGSQPSDEEAAGGEEGDPGSSADGVQAERDEALEDLLLDEDEDDPKATVDDRYKKLAAKNRKLKRQLAKRMSVLKRFEGLDPDDVLTRARQFDQLNEQIARLTPRQRAALYGGEVTDPAQPARPAPVADPEFDPSQLPFDPNENEINRYFAGMAKDNFELKRTIARLEGRLQQVDSRDTARTEAQERSQWKGAIDAAAATIPDDEVRILFKDAMAAAYRDRANHRKAPQDIIAHYLKGKLSPQQQKQANAAAAQATAGKGAPARGAQAQAQRIAESNKSLPRTVAPSGQPAPARSEKPSLADIRKRLTGSRI